MKKYIVYILTNYTRSVLYTGITNNLSKRIQEHAEDSIGQKKTFAGKYNCIYLVYYEEYQQVIDAISREKEIKNLTRLKKMELIKSSNPDFVFLNHQKE